MRIFEDVQFAARDSGPLALDLYVPGNDTQPTGLVCFAHGGGFVKGNRKGKPAGLLAEKLTEIGLAVASISYRLKTTDEELPTKERRRVFANRREAKEHGVALRPGLLGTRFEIARQDIGSAIEFLRDDKAPIPLSSIPLGYVGISAGGMVGMALAYPSDEDKLPQYEAPAFVIALGSTIVHPWALHDDGPPCLMIHSVEDKIISPSNCANLNGFIATTGAPIDIQFCARAGHNAPVRALFMNDAPDGTPYWQMALKLMRNAGMLTPSPADA